ncbi:HTH domain-containing protein [Haloactinopolyspora sp.]|uniref:helix-turn-helix transcriptional regulator n=1 Tax=Haloactinopolyspora sp. TaxID=1966353 RepID=UPI002629391F|nr:HTH domain-containing protein [Haloactinopolyspora sp.]
MGSQGATARRDRAQTARSVPRMRRPASPLVPEALGRAVNRSDRLDALTRELRAAGGDGRTSAWLAERLGVSARTVKRDVTALQQAGVPIKAASGPQGGYSLADVPGAGSGGLTTDEAIAVVVALQATPDQPFAAAGRGAVSKILRSLSPGERAEVARVAERIWIRPGEPTPTAEDTVRDVLTRAARECRVVVLDYDPGDGSAALTLQVESLGFAHSRGQWFALMWCRELEGGRWLRLDQIAAVQLTHETYEPRDVRDVFGPGAGSADAPHDHR